MYKYIVILLMLFFSSGVDAKQVSVSTDKAKLTFIVGSYNNLGVIDAAIKYEIVDRWQIYWREAGENGYPQNINWDGSGNLSHISLLWPAPSRFGYQITEDYYLESYGYKNEVVFPIEIVTKNSKDAANVKLDIDFAICEEICISENASLQIDVPSGYENTSDKEIISIAKSNIPKENGVGGLKVDSAILYAKDKLEKLRVYFNSKNQPQDIFIEADEKFAFYQPKKDDGFFEYDVLPLSNEKSLAGKDVIITAKGEDVSVELVKKLDLPILLSSDGVKYSFLMLLLFGFIGGLVLNVMPCVLPVLSLKLLSLIKHGGGNGKNVSVSFFVTSVGIVFSFLALALIIIILKAIGVSVGWGVHFQQPFFIIFLSLVISLFAANLWGVFEFKMPFVNQKLYNKSSEHNLIGYFLTGVLATILATPCTAPFLGAAVGFAISGDLFDIVFVFFSMGVGMAFPYLFFMFFPSLVTKLPKPGGWMIVVKKFLSVLLALTAVWLIWVLSSQIGMVAAIILILVILVKLVIIWLVSNTSLFFNKKLAYAVIAIITLCAFFLPVNFAVNVGKGKLYTGIWKEFKESQIKNMVKDGKVVFVDVTANWCLTCKFNKFNVLDSNEINQQIINRDIVAMRADWTNKNDDIANYIAKYNRSGIPFNIIYGPNAPSGIVLSELLNKNEIIEAFNKAEAKK